MEITRNPLPLSALVVGFTFKTQTLSTLAFSSSPRRRIPIITHIPISFTLLRNRNFQVPSKGVSWFSPKMAMSRVLIQGGGWWFVSSAIRWGIMGRWRIRLWRICGRISILITRFRFRFRFRFRWLVSEEGGEASFGDDRGEFGGVEAREVGELPRMVMVVT